MLTNISVAIEMLVLMIWLTFMMTSQATIVKGHHDHQHSDYLKEKVDNFLFKKFVRKWLHHKAEITNDDYFGQIYQPEPVKKGYTILMPPILAPLYQHDLIQKATTKPHYVILRGLQNTPFKKNEKKNCTRKLKEHKVIEPTLLPSKQINSINLQGNRPDNSLENYSETNNQKATLENVLNNVLDVLNDAHLNLDNKRDLLVSEGLEDNNENKKLQNDTATKDDPAKLNLSENNHSDGKYLEVAEEMITPLPLEVNPSKSTTNGAVIFPTEQLVKFFSQQNGDTTEESVLLASVLIDNIPTESDVLLTNVPLKRDFLTEIPERSIPTERVRNDEKEITTEFDSNKIVTPNTADDDETAAAEAYLLNPLQENLEKAAALKPEVTLDNLEKELQTEMNQIIGESKTDVDSLVAAIQGLMDVEIMKGKDSDMGVVGRINLEDGGLTKKQKNSSSATEVAGKKEILNSSSITGNEGSKKFQTPEDTPGATGFFNLENGDLTKKPKDSSLDTEVVRKEEILNPLTVTENKGNINIYATTILPPTKNFRGLNSSTPLTIDNLLNNHGHTSSLQATTYPHNEEPTTSSQTIRNQLNNDGHTHTPRSASNRHDDNGLTLSSQTITYLPLNAGSTVSTPQTVTYLSPNAGSTDTTPQAITNPLEDHRRSDVTVKEDEIQITRDDLINIIPAIVNNLRLNNITEEEIQVLSDIYGEFWPFIVELAANKDLNAEQIINDPAIKQLAMVEDPLTQQSDPGHMVETVTKPSHSDRKVRSQLEYYLNLKLQQPL